MTTRNNHPMFACMARALAFRWTDTNLVRSSRTNSIFSRFQGRERVRNDVPSIWLTLGNRPNFFQNLDQQTPMDVLFIKSAPSRVLSPWPPLSHKKTRITVPKSTRISKLWPRFSVNGFSHPPS
jgi:hypothetical protein